MAKQATIDDLDEGQVHERLIEVMRELRLPSPERMLQRIEKMLGRRDREDTLRELLAGCQEPDRREVKKAIRKLASSSDDWAREVDRLFAGYPPTA